MSFLRTLIRRTCPLRLRIKLFFARLYLFTWGVRAGLTALLKTRLREDGLVALTVPGIARPVLLRSGTADIQVFKHIFLEKQYQLPVAVTPQFIVDGGANVGYSSLYFANRYPQATIVAVELEASNAHLLRQNTAAYPNIIVVEAALWPTHTYLDLVDANAPSWSFRAVESSRGQGQIKTVTVNDLLAMSDEYFIDILKLDIEGAEKEIFSHAVSWLDQVNILIVELHERYSPGCSELFWAAMNQWPYIDLSRGENVILVNEKSIPGR